MSFPAVSARRSFLRTSAWRAFVWTVLGAAGVNVVFQFILTWQQFDSLVQARPILVIAAILNQIVAYGVLVPAMGRFYEHCGLVMSQWRIFGLISAGLASSRIIPAGEYFVWRMSLKRHHGGVGATTQWFILYSIAMNLSLALMFVVLELMVLVIYPRVHAEHLVSYLRYVPIAALVIVGGLMLALRIPRFREWVLRHSFEQVTARSLSPGGIIRERQLDRQDALWMALASFGTWLVEGYTLFLCFAALGLHIPLILSLCGYTFARLIANLPLSPGGIGEMEASAAVFFATYGHPIGLVVTATFLHRLITYWPPLLIGAGAYWFARQGKAEHITLGLQPFAPDLHHSRQRSPEH